MVVGALLLSLAMIPAEIVRVPNIHSVDDIAHTNEHEDENRPRASSIPCRWLLSEERLS